MTKYRLGADLGGTKLALALVNAAGELVCVEQVPTEKENAEALFQFLVREIRSFLKKHEVDLADLTGLGLGLPGKVDREAGIAVFQMMIPWPNFPIVERLQAEFPGLPLAIDNDVAVAVRAEFADSGLKPEDVFSYLTLSTGMSVQTMWQGKILRGAGFAGEAALVPAYFDSERPLIQDLTSGNGIAQRGQKVFQDESLTTADVFEKAAAGNEQGQKIIEEGALALAFSVYQIFAFYDPTLLVLGGSLAQKQPAYIEKMKAYLKNLLYPGQETALERIKISNLGSENGVLGAALLHEVKN